MKKDFFLTKRDYSILFIISLVITLTIIIRNLFFGWYYLFFWFCDFAPLLVLLALRLKNRALLQGVANVGFVVQISYLVALIMGFLGFNILGIREVLTQNNWLIFITIFTHFLNIILFFIIIKYEPMKMGIAHSLGVLALMYFPSIFFFSHQENINRVYSYLPFSNYLPFYTELWILYMFLVIVLPTHFVAKFLHSKFYSESP